MHARVITTTNFSGHIFSTLNDSINTDIQPEPSRQPMFINRIFAALAFCTISFSVMADTLKLPSLASGDTYLEKAINTAAIAFHNEGISGLSGITHQCYENQKEHRFYCIYLDIAGQEIDTQFAHAFQKQLKTKRPPTLVFYEKENFEERTIVTFIKAGVRLDEANKLMTAWRAVIIPRLFKRLMKELKEAQ